MPSPLAVVRGRAPIVLVAPHGGRRDPVARPWGSAPLKMNDLHTGSLTRELARSLDASALINETTDRNDVDLNRISDAHDRAPEFLPALADLLEDGLARHDTLAVVTVHGWNVAQPAVDVGLGVRPSAESVAGGAGAAVSSRFAAVLARLAARLHARGIATTPGLRYPARARENLVQLFAGRHYGDDPRAAVRRLSRLAPRVDAMQLELSLPLRTPGRWRDELVAACVHAFAGDQGAIGAWPPWDGAVAGAAERVAIEFVAAGMSGLAAIDERGGRLLLFPDDGRLVTFTGERVGVHRPDAVAGLRLRATPAGDVELSFDGPMLVFPDTLPFVDLERGLAAAVAVPAAVALRLVPLHRDGSAPCPFGVIEGRAGIDGVTFPIEGHGVRARRDPELGRGVRVALRLADGTGVLASGGDGVVCRDGAHVPIRGCVVDRDDARARLEIDDSDGRRIAATTELVHRLPVVPGVPGAGRLLFSSLRDGDRLAGWLQTPSG